MKELVLMETQRIFIALPVPDAVKHIIHGQMEEWQKQYRFRKWVHPQDLHLTLKFIGDAAPEQVKAIRERLQQLTYGKAITLKLRDTGTFGRPNAPSVFWLGLEDPDNRLQALRNAVEQAITSLGFPPETKPFRPHLTLARQFMGNHTAPPSRLAFPGEHSFTISEAVLYASHLNRRPMYEELEAFPFAAVSGESDQPV